MSRPFDCATVEGVLSYVNATPYASHRADFLSGGTANYAYRLHLKTPVGGRATLVLKHAKPYIKNWKEFSFDVERQKYEVTAMKHMKTILPHDALATVPTIHLFDEKGNVIIMDDCGSDTVPLKELMITNPPSVEAARTIGAALGEFLATLHAWGSSEDQREVLDLFEGNQQGKTIYAMVTYGRLVSTLSGDTKSRILAEAGLEVPEDKLKVLEKLAEEKNKQVLVAQETLSMGDFWPGNIVTSFSPEGTVNHIYVLDWELCKPGIAGTDIGQFCAEMHTLREFHESCAAPVSAAMTAFLEAYRTSMGVSERVARDAHVHAGTHLVVWTPRAGWGSKEKTRYVVEQGIELVLGGYLGGTDVIKGGVVGSLL